jgi:hypothetical protein
VALTWTLAVGGLMVIVVRVAVTVTGTLFVTVRLPASWRVAVRT